MTTKINVRVVGTRTLSDDDGNIVAEMSKQLSIPVAENAGLIRKNVYAAGREMDIFTDVRFVDDDGNEVASATCDTKSWKVAYADGKEHAPESVTFERSGARKPGDTWKEVALENGGRDNGPDLHLMSHAVLAELGLVERAQRGETTSLKAVVAEKDAVIESMVAQLKAAGMTQDQIDVILATSTNEAKAKSDKAKADKAAAKAAKAAAK